MESDAERFIELATRRLADNAELQLSAQEQLREFIGENAEEHRGELTAATESLARADTHPRRRWWRIALVALMLVISLPLLGMSVLEFRQIRGFKSIFSMDGFVAPKPDPHLSPAEKLLLYGADGGNNIADRWRPLWQSEPDNPAYLAEYAKADLSANEKLSDEVQQAAERIDPDNAWFGALAAAGMAEGAVSKVHGSSSVRRTTAGPAPVWTINDETRLNATLAAIHGLVGKPRFTGYQMEMMARRWPLFPASRDLVSQIQPLVYSASQTTGSIRLRKLADVLAAGAQQCAAKGDVAGFRQIVGDWRFLATTLVENSETLIDGLVTRVAISSPLANFRDAAKVLGLGEDAAYFSDLADRAEKENRARTKGRTPAALAAEEFIEQHSSLLFGLSGPLVARQVKSPPILTDDDLRPGRYADHALFGRVGSWLAWVVLGICAAAAAVSLPLRSRLASRMSGRMQDLFRFSDGAWIVLGGLVFPVLWYLAITRLTPLAAREWSVKTSLFLQPGGQFGCLILSMVIMPAVIASGRLAKRGAALGLAAGLPWLGWLAAAAALAGIPAFGGMRLVGGTGGACQIAALACLSISMIWIFGEIAVNFLNRGRQALRRATLARVLPPVWVAGMLMTVGLTFGFHAEEGRWIRQDRLLTVSKENPSPFQYESRVTQILRGELLEMIQPPASGQ